MLQNVKDSNLKETLLGEDKENPLEEKREQSFTGQYIHKPDNVRIFP